MKVGHKILILVTIFLITFVIRVFSNDRLEEIILADSNLIGDVNNDNRVSLLDYVLVRKHILGIKLTGDALARADVNNDNKVNLLDYVLIRKSIISGKPITEVKAVNKYKITFNVNGGSVSPTSKDIKSGEKYGELPTPTRSGYKFVGWFTKTSSNFDYKYYSDKYSDLKKAFGTNEKALKEHWYIFGIKEGRKCSSDNISPNDTVTGNITLYAIWEKLEVVKYKVTYNANGGSISPTSKEYNAGEKYGNMPTPTRSGYKFVGWFTVNNGQFDYEFYYNKYDDLKKAFGLNMESLRNHWFNNGLSEGRVCNKYNISKLDGVTGNITLYAGWEKLPYKVNLDANGGSVNPTSKDVIEGYQYGELPTPTRKGYKFVGWFTKASSNFDYKYYSDKYSDLKKAFGTNEKALKEHWYTFGLKEGRVCSSDNISSLSTVKNNNTLYAIWEQVDTGKIHFMNTGTSDAIIIESGGHYGLIDASHPYNDNTIYSTSDKKYSVQHVVEYLNSLGVKYLDFVIATHPHSDHIGGMPVIASNFVNSNTKYYYRAYEGTLEDSTTDYDNKGYYERAINAMAKSKAIFQEVTGKTPTITLGDFTIQLLNTEKATDNEKNGGKVIGENKNSIVQYIKYKGKYETLLAADMEREDEMAIANAIGKVEILKVGHHSHYSATSYPFVKKLSPKRAIVTNYDFFETFHPMGYYMEKSLGTKIYYTSIANDAIVVEYKDDSYNITPDNNISFNLIRSVSSGKSYVWKYIDYFAWALYRDGEPVYSEWYKDDNGTWYYMNYLGACQTGWAKLSWNGKENWYYFNGDCSMVANKCMTINNEKFCFNASGACYSGRGC